MRRDFTCQIELVFCKCLFEGNASLIVGVFICIRNLLWLNQVSGSGGRGSSEGMYRVAFSKFSTIANLLDLEECW